MKIVLHPDQPETTDIKLGAGLFVKVVRFAHADMIAPQHAHAFDHLSFVYRGAVCVEVDGVCLGDFRAGDFIFIKARAHHFFRTLAPETIVHCIHNIDRSGGDVETIEVPGAEAIEYMED